MDLRDTPELKIAGSLGVSWAAGREALHSLASAKPSPSQASTVWVGGFRVSEGLGLRVWGWSRKKFGVRAGRSNFFPESQIPEYNFSHSV